jgi:hypothetical protein
MEGELIDDQQLYTGCDVQRYAAQTKTACTLYFEPLWSLVPKLVLALDDVFGRTFRADFQIGSDECSSMPSSNKDRVHTKF